MKIFAVFFLLLFTVTSYAYTQNHYTKVANDYCLSHGFQVNTVQYKQCMYDVLTYETKLALKKLNFYRSKIVGCEDDHFILQNYSGQVIKLDDGTLLRVNDIDRANAIIWVPMDNIVMCFTGSPYVILINTDENDKVNATFVP